MDKTLTFAIAVVLALTSSGCIANMGDLRDRAADEENLTSAAIDATTGTTTQASPRPNETVKLPPVARISIFESGGALLYKAAFTAEDPAETIFVKAATELSLIAGDSEAVERGATLTGFAWTVNDKPVEGTRQAKYAVEDPGLYTIMLQVTDSNGKTDMQHVKVALMPEPYEVVTELVSGQVVGQEGDAPADVAWDLAEPAEPATVQSVTIVASPPVHCDAILELLDAQGNSLGSADSSGIQDLDNTETLELGSIAFGAYTIRIAPFTCVATEVPIVVTVVLLPIVEGLEGAGDGHGHAH